MAKLGEVGNNGNGCQHSVSGPGSRHVTLACPTLVAGQVRESFPVCMDLRECDFTKWTSYSQNLLTEGTTGCFLSNFTYFVKYQFKVSHLDPLSLRSKYMNSQICWHALLPAHALKRWLAQNTQNNLEEAGSVCGPSSNVEVMIRVDLGRSQAPERWGMWDRVIWRPDASPRCPEPNRTAQSTYRQPEKLEDLGNCSRDLGDDRKRRSDVFRWVEGDLHCTELKYKYIYW